MDQPLVCCILPYHTSRFVEQALRCFQSQTYPNRELFSEDTSRSTSTIGVLRNNLVSNTPRNCLIAHWDSDDWSSPERLEDQVRHFRNNFEGISDYSGPRCMITGYHDLLFYDVEQDRVLFYESKMTGYAVGTSLMYRREVWERTPFPDQSVGEDAAWQHAVRREQGHAVVSTSSLVDGKPLMVARQHAGCASQKSEQPRSTIMWGQNYSTASPELESAVRLVVDTNLKVAHTS